QHEDGQQQGKPHRANLPPRGIHDAQHGAPSRKWSVRTFTFRLAAYGRSFSLLVPAGGPIRLPGLSGPPFPAEADVLFLQPVSSFLRTVVSGGSPIPPG